MGRFLSDDKKIEGFFNRVNEILKELDRLVDEYDMRDEVVMVNCVAVETDEDEFGVNIQASYLMNIAEAEDIIHLMTGAMEQYEMLSRKKMSSYMRIINDNPTSLN